MQGARRVEIYELVVRSSFRANHCLRMPDGTVEPLHEHLWRVEAFFESDQLDEAGMVADFGRLRQEIADATSDLSGAKLNDLPAFTGSNPSTELLAKHIAERLVPRVPKGVTLEKVRVWETEDCAAAYRSPPASR
jgi:6-pyruvoyltetrahydropterin/6-carboxytetrahydropterin synthase